MQVSGEDTGDCVKTGKKCGLFQEMSTVGTIIKKNEPQTISDREKGEVNPNRSCFSSVLPFIYNGQIFPIPCLMHLFLSSFRNGRGVSAMVAVPI